MDSPASQSQPHPQRARRPRGKLAQLKCAFCRKDKQKCEPQARQWPQKCRRCELKGFNCSPNTRKERAQRRGGAKDHAVHSTLSRTTLDPPGVETAPSVELEGPMSSWTLVDLSNAVSILKLLQRVEFRFELWRIKHEKMFEFAIGHLDVRGAHVSPESGPFIVCDIDYLCNEIAAALKTRLGTMTSRSTPIPERLALRNLLYEAAGRPNLSSIQPLFCVGSVSGLWTRDGFRKDMYLSVLPSVADVHTSDDVGASLLRHDHIFEELSSTLSSTSDPASDDILVLARDSFLLQARFRAVYLRMEHPLSKWSDGMPGLRKNYQPIVFDSYHWMRLIDLHQYWKNQDLLGTSVLHFILEHLEHDFPGHGRITPAARQEMVQKIASHVRPDHPVDRLGRTLLHVAAQFGLEDVLRVLLELGMDGGETTSLESTALHYSASVGNLEICKILLDRDYFNNMNDKDIDRSTALHHAARNGHKDVVELLLSEEDITESINCGNLEGKTPLMMAFDSENATYQALLEYPDIDLTATDERNATALHYAVGVESISAVRDIAARVGILVNERDDRGYTALHSTVWVDLNVAGAIVKELLRNPFVDAGIKNNDGLTPLWAAAERGHLEVCQLLGVRIDGCLLVPCKDRNTELPTTPREVALEKGHTHVADLLAVFEAKIDSSAVEDITDEYE
ncbi:ankyrin repeat-containing domain protein [Immersiella caudata]|uniref:Ankyrin repeat-containing domain protein n=1 Tax=Immersiella caudata TaxID=314043 RepID=A0AA40CAL5_9PEZI|nr:ankyrin repeat-containing domain protein [Immersiella caudata]